MNNNLKTVVDIRLFDRMMSWRQQEHVHVHPPAIKVGDGERARYFKPRGCVPFTGSEKDRSLRGKARIKARRIEKRNARTR